MKRISILIVLIIVSTYSVFAQASIYSVEKWSANTPELSSLIGTDDNFGGAIAMIGDIDGNGVEDVAVGMYGYDNNNGGCVILFLDSDGQIIDHSVIADGEGGLPSGSLGSYSPFGNMFGTTVEGLGDIDGDGIPDIIVGANEGLEAPVDAWWMTSIGSLWVLFLNDDGTVKDYQWLYSQSEAWTDSLPQAAHLDYDIKNVGDIDGDDINDIAVSAIVWPNVYGEDTIQSGAVLFLTLNSDGTVKDTSVLSSPTQQYDEFFGCSIDVLGDVNGDGVNDLAIGAYGYDASSNLEGAYYVVLMADEVSAAEFVRVSNNEGGYNESIGLMDIFGRSLTATGDLDGDCIPDLIVSEPWYDNIDSKEGRIHVHYLNSDGTVKSYLSFGRDTDELSAYIDGGDRFGTYVQFLGDINNDTYPEIAVGATLDDDGGEDVGAIYIISLDGTTECTQSTNLTNSESNIQVYPNPADSYITIKSPNNYPNAIISIMDTMGKIVLKQKINNSIESINIENIKNGVYILEISKDSKSSKHKVIIQ